MRLALALMLALALALPAGAQMPTTAERRPFADADYEAYFAPGIFRTESPTYSSTSRDDRQRVSGKIVLAYVETMPKWDVDSPYPFLKLKGVVDQDLGKPDAKLKARVYSFSDADFEKNGFIEVWLSNNNRAEISQGDVRAGIMRDYLVALWKASGADPAAYEAADRAAIVGKWISRCAFIKNPTFEVECIETNLQTKQSVIRRYARQLAMG